MTVEHIVDAEAFVERVLRAEGPVIVDFHADWCGPCRILAPVIEALSEKWAGTVRFAKVDVDRNPEVAGALGVASLPTVARFDGGEVASFIVGAAPPHVIERELGLVAPAPDGDGAAGEGEDEPTSDYQELAAAAEPDRPARGVVATLSAWWNGRSSSR